MSGNGGGGSGGRDDGGHIGAVDTCNILKKLLVDGKKEET